MARPVGSSRAGKAAVRTPRSNGPKLVATKRDKPWDHGLTDDETVKFFGKAHPLSNFYPCLINLVSPTGEVVTARSAEAVYQAMKFCTTDTDYCQRILKTANPAECKKLGRSRDHPIDPNWGAHARAAMSVALSGKFHRTHNPDLVDQLLATGDRVLIERSPFDAIWGWGRNKCGGNWLGELLMQRRAQLRDEPHVYNEVLLRQLADAGRGAY